MRRILKGYFIRFHCSTSLSRFSNRNRVYRGFPMDYSVEHFPKHSKAVVLTAGVRYSRLFSCSTYTARLQIYDYTYIYSRFISIRWQQVPFIIEHNTHIYHFTRTTLAFLHSPHTSRPPIQMHPHYLQINGNNKLARMQLSLFISTSFQITLL